MTDSMNLSPRSSDRVVRKDVKDRTEFILDTSVFEHGNSFNLGTQMC